MNTFIFIFTGINLILFILNWFKYIQGYNLVYGLIKLNDLDKQKGFEYLVGKLDEKYKILEVKSNEIEALFNELKSSEEYNKIKNSKLDALSLHDLHCKLVLLSDQIMELQLISNVRDIEKHLKTRNFILK